MCKQAQTHAAHAASVKTICLPSGHNRSEDEVDYICAAIMQLLAEPGRDRAEVPPSGWLKYKSDTLEFFAKAKKHGFILDRLDKSGVYVQLITEQAWSIWQAATDAADGGAAS